MTPRPSRRCLALQGRAPRLQLGRTESRGCWGWDQLLSLPHPLLASAPAGRGRGAWPGSDSCLSHGLAAGNNSPQLISSRLSFTICYTETKTASLPCWEGAATAKAEPPGPRHSVAPLCQPRGKAHPAVPGVGPKPRVPLCKQRLGPCGAGVPARWGRWRLACCCARADLSVPYASLFQPCLPSEPIVDHNVLSALEKEISCNCFAGLAARCKTFCLSAPSPAWGQG